MMHMMEKEKWKSSICLLSEIRALGVRVYGEHRVSSLYLEGGIWVPKRLFALQPRSSPTAAVTALSAPFSRLNENPSNLSHA